MPQSEKATGEETRRKTEHNLSEWQGNGNKAVGGPNEVKFITGRKHHKPQWAGVRGEYTNLNLSITPSLIYLKRIEMEHAFTENKQMKTKQSYL